VTLFACAHRTSAKTSVTFSEHLLQPEAVIRGWIPYKS